VSFPFSARLAILAATAAGLTAQVVTAPDVSVARWPGGRQAAIPLTVDDGMQTHLDVAAPILRKHGLHATFFVATGSGPWQKRQDEWRKLAAEGICGGK